MQEREIKGVWYQNRPEDWA